MTTSPEVTSSSEAPTSPDAPDAAGALPSATLGGDSKGSIEQVTLLLFIVVPFVALLAAVPLAWGWG